MSEEVQTDAEKIESLEKQLEASQKTNADLALENKRLNGQIQAALNQRNIFANDTIVLAGELALKS